MKLCNKQDIINTCQIIVNNIERFGVYRYDRVDTQWLPVISKNTLYSKVLRKFVLIFDAFFPIVIRKLLKVKKSIPPTTYTHIGEAYLLSEKYNTGVVKSNTSIEIAELCINHYLEMDGSNVWWNHSPPKPVLPLINNWNKRATMNMHSKARCNIMLLNLFYYYKDVRYLDIAYKALITTINNHKITTYSDNSKSINYYYNTNDCTLNVNSEFIHWISLIPIEMKTKALEDVFYGIIKLLIQEQNVDGSWSYFSKKYNSDNIIPESYDCHHTATVLYNLINVTKSKWIDNNTLCPLLYSIEKGMLFFIDSFFDENTGKAITLVNFRRPAGPVQYSEAVFAFYEYLSSTEINNEKMKNRIRSLLHLIIPNIIKLVKRNGSAPGDKVIKWINLNSIRWGNGPILQALTMILTFSFEDAK
jgi:hypothetical protein